jgi:hypothetical protein
VCGRRLRGVSDGELAHEASYGILLRRLIQGHPAVAAYLLAAGRLGGAGSPTPLGTAASPFKETP